MKSEADRIVEHLSQHKEFARKAISRSYPFSAEELRKYSGKVDWECVSMNSNIVWTESLFKEFEEKKDVGALGRCSSFPWTEEFIDKNIEDLFYDVTPECEVEKTGFAWNEGLPWSERFIDKYAEHWHWMFLSMNESIPFTKELLDKYADKWDYDSLEFNKKIVKNETLKSYLNIFYNRDVKEYYHNCEFCFKGEEIFEEYKGKACSIEFCFCPNFNWTDKFASKLRNKLKNKIVAEKLAQQIRWVTFNHWSIDVLEGFGEFWDYQLLYLVEELNDYLAFAIKGSERLEEVMKGL